MKNTLKKLSIIIIIAAVLFGIFFVVKQEDKNLMWSNGFGLAYIMFLLMLSFAYLIFSHKFIYGENVKFSEKDKQKIAGYILYHMANLSVDNKPIISDKLHAILQNAETTDNYKIPKTITELLASNIWLEELQNEGKIL